MTLTRASIVVNTLNRLPTLPTTLRSLEALRWPEVEVIVVNGPSDDGTDVHLELFWKDKVRVVTCPVANLSVSRNLGIEASSGEVVVFVDDDGVPEPDWLLRLLEPYANPRVGAVGGWVRDKSGVSYQAKHIRSFRNGKSDTLLADPVSPTEDSLVGLIGVNSSIRRSVAVEIGGFDERYAYFLDETDLVFRVQEAGYEVVNVPAAEVHHKYAASHIRPVDRSKVTISPTSHSIAYFTMRHGPTYAAPIEEKFGALADARRSLERDIDWKLGVGQVDEVTAARLRNEVAAGVSAGIAAFFDGPLLASLSAPKSAFKPLPRRTIAPLRLAMVCEQYFPRQVGGVAVILGELAKELAHQGHEISIFTRAKQGVGHSVDYEDGVWVHRLPNNAPAAEPPPGFPDLPHWQGLFAKQVLAELDRVNEHRQFMAVIGSIWDLDLAGAIASGRYNVGLYLVTSYMLALESKPEWTRDEQFFRDHFMKMVDGEKWALGSVDRVFASTKAILADTINHYGVLDKSSERVTLIPFGLPDYARAETQKTNDDVVITFVGRLERRKGIDLLLEALPKLLRGNERVKVRIVGEDYKDSSTGRTNAESFAAANVGASWLDRVKFLGYVDDEGLREEFESCDIFVAPSRYESFGLIYVEAMRAGKPSIGVRAGGVSEVIEDGVTGLLVDPDSVSLGRALAELVADPARRATMGQAGRRRYETHFSMSAFAERFSKDVVAWLGVEGLR